MNENATRCKEDVKWYLGLALGWWQMYHRFDQSPFVLDQWRWSMDGARRQYGRYQYWFVR